MVHALQHEQAALLVQPSSPRYLRSTHISYTDQSSIADPRRVYFPGARPDLMRHAERSLRTKHRRGHAEQLNKLRDRR